MKKNIISILLPAAFFLFAFEAGAQLVINEVSSSNCNTMHDEDGDTPDWIELYNGGTSAVNMGGYRISDNVNQPAKWIFPSGVSVPPSGFLTFFASGKDRKQFFNHWETVVKASDSWRYTRPMSEPDSNWRRLTTFNDAFWSLGPGGIGYGDGDDSTIIPSPATSVFMRRVFNIVDTSDIACAVFHMDYDDAFVAYVNGVEIARSNIGVNGTPASFVTLAMAEHEARMYAGGQAERFSIGKALLKTCLKNGNNVLAIQVHNVSATSSDMTSRPWLSLGIKSASSNYGPVPAWFDLNASYLHTNFKLSQSGETLMLSDNTGTVLNVLSYDTILTDDSYGRQPDASASLRYFGTPTPGATNNSVAGSTGYTEDPVYSLSCGFYPSVQNLVLSTATPGGIIHYTTDGSQPGPATPVYTSPISIDSTMVIKARTYHSSLLEGEIITNSYFIDDSTSSTLPVVSLSVIPGQFFDTVTGIYVKGPNAEASVPFFGANFWQEVEVPVHIEFYDKQRNLGFEQEAGLEIYGNYSRSYPQKSMKLIARDDYGDGSFNYQLFPGKDIHSFKQFILRNAGTDWNSAHMRDAFVHTLVQNSTDNDVMAYQPSAVYLNGQYWGVYNIREKINKDYIAENHQGVDPDSVDLLEYNGYEMSGTNDAFEQMGIYVLLHDMTNPAEFAVVDSYFDLKNFADYFAVETWSNNWDWLTNNVRYWRENKAGQKWRYILWDLDNGLGGAWSYVFNSLDTNLHKPLDYTSILFNRMLQNPGYKRYFINRYADLLNTTLKPQNYCSLLYRLRDTINSEMPRHFKRWGSGFNNPNWGVQGQGTYNDWKNYHINEVANFSGPRQVTARNHIQETFSLKKQVPVTLNVVPPDAGKILINTITLDEFPWAGIYFDSVPVTITAIAGPGCEFSFWQSQIKYPSPQFDSTLTFNPDTSDIFTAYFFGIPDTAKITISEINYNSSLSADAGDWVELHNYSSWPFDLSKWKLKDSQNSNMFVFPVNTVLDAGEYLVVCEDTAKFRSVYPSVTNVTGPFPFGLSSASDAVRLVDKDMNVYLSVYYTSVNPWPVDANGTGKTLELLNPHANLNDALNWFAGCPGGSPGGPFVPCDNSSVETIEASSDGIISVYPNPVTENLYMDFSLQNMQGAITVELFDFSGRPVYKLDHVEQEQIMIHNEFSPGMYIYRVISEGYMKSGKVLFQ